jgi:hypothetical protein
MRHAFDVLTAAGFALAIMVPGGLMATRTQAPDLATEQRLPAPKPAWPTDRASLAAFPQAFEAYFNDYFGLRNRLNRLHQLAWYRLFDMSPSGIVVTGKDRSLFVVHELDNLRREKPLTQEQLALKAKILKQRRDWLAARGIKYLVVLVPNKATVYPELAPASVRPLYPKGPAEQLADHLKAHTDVEAIDLTAPLVAAKAERRTHPRLDAHWNEYGGYVGYRATVEKLAEWFPGMRPVAEDECVIEDRESGGDLAYIMGFPELTEIRTFMRPAQSRMKGLDGWGGFVNQSLTSRVDDPGLPRAVIFHDSFMTAEKQFLSEHFSEARYRWVYTDFDVAAINETKPHVVIQEMIERSLPAGLTVNPAAIAPGSPSAAPAVPAGPVARGQDAATATR